LGEILNGELSDAALESGGYSRRQIAQAVSPRLQELIILPTEKCNLRCTYCYEDFAIGRMSEETQAALEAFIAQRVPGLVKLSLNWFGGEPLVAKGVVLRISRFAQKVCEEHNVQFDGALTTNAVVLDKELLSELLDCRQNFYQITLDGWGETHDQVRKYADGRGSFDQIWQNLTSFKSLDRDFEVMIRVHVRRENLKELPALLTALGAEFGGDNRFRVHFEHLRDLGGEGGKTILSPVTRSELLGMEAGFRAIFREAAINAGHILQPGSPAVWDQRIAGPATGLMGYWPY